MSEIKSDYEEWHRAMAAAEAGRTDLRYPWHRTTLKLLPDLNGKKVLEVGCGRGDFAAILGGLFPRAQIVATDFSGTAIEQAQLKPGVGSNVSFHVADAQELPFDPDFFDYLISCECLEHVESAERALQDFSRVLKPGGGFVITTENYFNGMLLAWMDSWIRRKPFNSGSGVQPHENFFLFWKVRRIIEKSGLRVTHMESNHFVWLLLPGFAPNTFFTEDFASPAAKRFFRPFGRHFAFRGIKRG